MGENPEFDQQIHACRGHAAMVDHGTYAGQYLPEPTEHQQEN